MKKWPFGTEAATGARQQSPFDDDELARQAAAVALERAGLAMLTARNRRTRSVKDKSDLGPAAWAPATDRGRCLYAIAYLAAAAAYRLPVTAAEHAALNRDTAQCRAAAE